MSAAALARLAARVASDYANGGHRTYFSPDLNDVAGVVGDAVAADTSALAAALAAGQSLAAALAIVGAAQGVGAAGDEVPLVVELGSATFVPWGRLLGIPVNTQNGAWQMLPQDFGTLLLTSSGTNTWTLPASTDLPNWWQVRYKNRSGNNLTLARTGTDTINGAGSNVTIATGAQGTLIRAATGAFETF